MLRQIVAICLVRRPLVLISFTIFLALGLAAFATLNIEAYPDPAPPIIEIIAQYPGQSPEEAVDLVPPPAPEEIEEWGVDESRQHLAPPGGVRQHPAYAAAHGDEQAVELRHEQRGPAARFRVDAGQMLELAVPALEDIHRPGAAAHIEAVATRIEKEVVGIAARVELLRYPAAADVEQGELGGVSEDDSNALSRRIDRHRE